MLYDITANSYATNRLLGALVGLARVTDGNEHLIRSSCTALIAEVLSFVLTSSKPEKDILEDYIKRIEEEKWQLVPDCRFCASPCGRHNAYDLARLYSADPEIRDLKYLLLSGACRIAACARRWQLLGQSKELDRFLYTALIVIGIDDYSLQDLLSLITELGVMEQKCMELVVKNYSVG